MSTLTSEERRELDNPREEAAFQRYYSALHEEQVLETNFVSKEQLTRLASQTPSLSEYKQKIHNVDLDRISNLQPVSFRKLSHTKHDHDANTAPTADSNKLAQLGFINYRPTKFNLNSSYMRPDLKQDQMVRAKSMFYQNEFQVVYNMDELDLLFLNHVNETFSCSLSIDMFEIVVTFFELELFKLQRILPPTIKDRTTIDIQQYQRAILYGSDDGTGCSSESDQECAVCGEEDSSDSTNSIVFCDGCDIAVHQECYGVSFIPEGPWLCRKCLILRNSRPKCLVCPSTTGAFKQTDGGDWCHSICTLWIKEIYFSNPIWMEPIEGIDKIPKERWRLSCYICKQAMGAPIQCSKSNCFLAYHVTCGKRAGLYMKMRRGVQGAMKNPNTLVSYCDKHCSLEWSRNHDMQTGIQKTRLYFNDLKNGIIKDSDSDLVPVTNSEYKELEDTKSMKFQWRLQSSVYVIPELILNKLEEFIKQNNLTTIPRLVLNDIAKYYTIKTEDLGQQLIKKPDVFNLATLPEEELISRDKVLQNFDMNTQKLLKAVKDISSRGLEIVDNTNDQLKKSYEFFKPAEYIIVEFLSMFTKVQGQINYPRNCVKPTLDEIFHLAKHGHYNDNIDSIVTDLDKFFNWVQHQSNEKYDQLKSIIIIWNRAKKRKLVKTKRLLENVPNWKKSLNYTIDQNLEIENNQDDQAKIKKASIIKNKKKGKIDHQPVLRRMRRRVQKLPMQTTAVRTLRSGRSN